MLPLKIKLPENFLDEEVRCEHTVTHDMKEVWAIELDLLQQVQTVCEKYNIRYVASGGTLLGAVRHKGFIPWDDDIDIVMLREDYEKFCSLYNEFQAPYELQFYGKTKGYFTGHAQLRNTSTTGVLKAELNGLHSVPYNQGIFIDIFPLDSVPDDNSLRHKQMRIIKKYKKLSRRIYKGTEGYNGDMASGKLKLFHYLCKFLPKIFSYDYFYIKFINECIKYNDHKTKYVSVISFVPDNEKLYIERNNLEKIIVSDFEFMKIKIEENYDSVLKVQYGDYMKFVKGDSYHGEIIFDTKTPYEEWRKDHTK